jgi:hypothetical protein
MKDIPWRLGILLNMPMRYGAMLLFESIMNVFLRTELYEFSSTKYSHSFCMITNTSVKSRIPEI